MQNIYLSNASILTSNLIPISAPVSLNLQAQPIQIQQAHQTIIPSTIIQPTQFLSTNHNVIHNDRRQSTQTIEIQTKGRTIKSLLQSKSLKNIQPQKQTEAKPVIIIQQTPSHLQAPPQLLSQTYQQSIPIISNSPIRELNIARSNEITNKILEARLRSEQNAKIEEQQRNANKEGELTEESLRKKVPLTKLAKVSKKFRRKNFYECGERQKQRLKRDIKEVLLESTQFLRNMGLCLSAIEISPIEMDECDFKLNIKPHVSEPQQHEPTTNNLLFIKDKHSISDKAYHDLKSKCYLNIPTIFKLKQRRSELNSMFEIHNNEMGVFISMKDKLVFRLKIFFDQKYTQEELDDPTVFKDNIIHVKLGADGTNIGRNLKLLNFTFTIVNEGAKAKTAHGNYTLGIFEIENENHESVTACFKELIDEIQNLNQVTVYEKTLKVVYYFSADWKMLGHSLGILSANSKYPCIWCKCCKEDFYRTDLEWSITDSKLGCRTHEEHAAIINHPNNKKIVKYGYERKPIFKDIIPFSRYMIDMLHLFLRISDTLFNLLVKDCSLADNFDMSAISKFDVSIYKHMNSLQVFLNTKCNVKFSFIWIAETKKLTWRDLVGPEKNRLFENFNLAEIMPDHEMFDSVAKIWNDFYEILNYVKHVKIDAINLKQRTTEWLKLYLTVYNKNTVTPYMHAFVAHLHEFVHLYKDINAFNCQGLEKLNDLSTGQYFKGTNKSDTALHQMLKKRNRLEYLSAYVYDD